MKLKEQEAEAEYYMSRVLYICIMMSFYMTALYARLDVKAEGMSAQKDTTCVVKTGYGQSESRAKAEAIAQKAARNALLLVLRDSVAVICHEVRVFREGKEEYLQIKYFTDDDPPSKYYFHEDDVLNDITVVNKECVLEKNKRYKARCVLSAPRADFSRASDIVFLRILKILSNYSE